MRRLFQTLLSALRSVRARFRSVLRRSPTSDVSSIELGSPVSGEPSKSVLPQDVPKRVDRRSPLSHIAARQQEDFDDSDHPQADAGDAARLGSSVAEKGPEKTEPVDQPSEVPQASIVDDQTGERTQIAPAELPVQNHGVRRSSDIADVGQRPGRPNARPSSNEPADGIAESFKSVEDKPTATHEDRKEAPIDLGGGSTVDTKLKSSTTLEKADADGHQESLEDAAFDSQNQRNTVVSLGSVVPTVPQPRGLRSPRRPSPKEDDNEFAISILEFTDSNPEYARWNSALVQHVLTSCSEENDQAYICVTPRILASLYSAAGHGLLTPREAEISFEGAVARAYKARVFTGAGHLRTFRRYGCDGLPDCLAFLAASVLAAYRMKSDEEAAGHAYYVRLASLLDCPSSGTYPVGFSPTAFESLWGFLRNWLKREHSVQLAMPGPDVGLRRFVALPMTHVPLRSLDIEKLPAFFSWAGYEAGSRVRKGQLLTDLLDWDRAQSVLTPTGAAALSDKRLLAVLAQVGAELESWDGSVVESSGRRSGIVEILFDPVQGRPELFYLPRRPLGFPDLFDDGEHVFEATEEGWYDPAGVGTKDGQLLANGFEWQTTVNGAKVVLRRRGATAIVLARSSDYSGFLSQRYVPRGVKCAVLCQERLARIADEYLSEISQQRCQPATDPRLPSGWCLFTTVNASRITPPPNGLEALEVDPNIGLLVEGGLRIGRHWTWMIGCPPRLFVTGLKDREDPTIDGERVRVGNDGAIQTTGLFDHVGVHMVQVGLVRRRFEIVAPEITLKAPVGDGKSMALSRDSARRIGLPRGAWSVVGSLAGQVATPLLSQANGCVVECHFTPAWAIQVGAGPGAVVVPIGEPPAPCCEISGLNVSTKAVFQRWVSLIYDAHVRRPSFHQTNLSSPLGEKVRRQWKQYVTLAKQLKRVWKGR